MKTTVELSDELLARSRAVALREGSTLRALLEEGLHLALKRRSARGAKAVPVLPVHGRGGLSPAFQEAGWAAVRDEIHGLAPPPQGNEPRR